MPSMFKPLFLASAAATLLSTVTASSQAHFQSLSSSASSSSLDSCVSCQSCATDSCQTNTPGGLLLLTQFWDYSPATGPSDSWTIHGLWPDNCDGSYDALCDPTRNRSNISQILLQFGATETLDYMNRYWLDMNGNDNQFWSHEWNKHGTCVSTLEPRCYPQDGYRSDQEVVDFFNTATQLFKSRDTYQALAKRGIVPSRTARYRLSDLKAAIKEEFGFEPAFRCRSGHLNEVWYYFYTQGRSTSADNFIQTDPIARNNNCPATGIMYTPK